MEKINNINDDKDIKEHESYIIKNKGIEKIKKNNKKKN